jgi:hypothetical protein
MRNAPIRLPAAHAARTLLILDFTQDTNADHCEEVERGCQIKPEDWGNAHNQQISQDGNPTLLDDCLLSALVVTAGESFALAGGLVPSAGKTHDRPPLRRQTTERATVAVQVRSSGRLLFV